MRNRKSVDWILGESRGDLKIQERTIRALTAGEAKGTREERLLRAGTAQPGRQSQHGSSDGFYHVKQYSNQHNPSSWGSLLMELREMHRAPNSTKWCRRERPLCEGPGDAAAPTAALPRAREPLLGVTPGVSLAPGGGHSVAPALTGTGSQGWALLWAGLGAQRAALCFI